jgi:GcrA cell cycle regulator
MMESSFWSPAEDAILRANLGSINRVVAAILAEHGFCRSARAVNSRRHSKTFQGIPYKPQPDAWPEERITALLSLHAKGLSGGMIAEEMGRRGNPMSRSAAIGKLSRLGLKLESDFANHVRRIYHNTGSSTPRPRKPPPPTPATRQFQHGAGCEIGATPKPPRPAAVTGPTPDSLNIPMWDPRFEAGCCRFPTSGEGVDTHLFCAAPAERGLPYCGPHARACFNGYGGNPPTEPKSERVASKPQPADDEPQPLDFEAAA